MYFSNSHASRLLPMPAWPVTETRRTRRSRAGGVEQVLEQAQLVVAADERRLEPSARPRPPRSATTRSARQPGRRCLALEHCSPAGSKAIALGGRAGVASPTRTVPGRRARLEARRGVDEVARDHALVRGAERDRRLAGQDAGPRLEPGAEAPTASTRSSAARTARSASSSWAVGRAPDGHHGVADELLDGAAVAVDDARARASK